MYIQVIRHEWSDDGNTTLVYFNVMTKRPTDEKFVKGGEFMLFVKAEEINKYPGGKKFVLQDDA